MLQCTSEIEKAQPQFWPTLANKKCVADHAVGSSSAWGSSSGGARPKETRATKMDKHFPNLLDTIEVEDADGNSSGLVQDNPRLVAATVKPPSAAGAKGPASSSKRAPAKKKQQLLLFSTDMNFNRNWWRGYFSLTFNSIYYKYETFCFIIIVIILPFQLSS